MRWALLIIQAIILSLPVYAGEVSLAWDHSASPEVIGYKIYYGKASGDYSGHDDVPYQTTWTVMGLAPGMWYFTATAFDAEANESDYSNEVTVTVTVTTSPCDVNGDSAVNTLDLQVLANMVIYGLINLKYDINQDGFMDVLDLQILANVVLGQRVCPQ